MYNKNIIYIYSFYRFLKIVDKKLVKSKLDNFFNKKIICGTILIADEGINASISGDEYTLLETLRFIRKELKIRNLNLKVNKNRFLPFNKMKVRLKKEIVSLGKGRINMSDRKVNYIHPSNWNELIERKDIKLIDIRNTYETKIGNFKNSIDPNTNSFREFPKKFNKIGIKKNDNLALYCTGGIRCEKVSAYLQSKGYNNVNQLKGGVISYLEYVKNSKSKNIWNGECFVFDKRVAINSNLRIGNYLQCYGCRRPIKKKDTKSKDYLKGVHCPYCINERSVEQKRRSNTRQDQIDKANKINFLP